MIDPFHAVALPGPSRPHTNQKRGEPAPALSNEPMETLNNLITRIKRVGFRIVVDSTIRAHLDAGKSNWPNARLDRGLRSWALARFQ